MLSCQNDRSRHGMEFDFFGIQMEIVSWLLGPCKTHDKSCDFFMFKEFVKMSISVIRHHFF